MIYLLFIIITIILVEEITQYYFTKNTFSRRIKIYIKKQFHGKDFKETFVSKIESGFIRKIESDDIGSYDFPSRTSEIAINPLGRFFSLKKWDKTIQKIIPVYTESGFERMLVDIVDTNIHEFLHYTFLEFASKELEKKKYQIYNHEWLVQFLTEVIDGYIHYNKKIELKQISEDLYIYSSLYGDFELFFNINDDDERDFSWIFTNEELNKIIEFDFQL